MGFVCYRPKGSCKSCEHYHFDKSLGSNTCFAHSEAKPEECYYNFLEQLRRSGEINMYGAVPNLIAEFHLTQNQAADILSHWMKHYSEFAEIYHWAEN